MKVLLDTNIIIHREAGNIRNNDIGILFNWLDRIKARKCIHPLTITELKGHSDPKVVRTMAIKVKNYNDLKTLALNKKRF